MPEQVLIVETSVTGAVGLLNVESLDFIFRSTLQRGDDLPNYLDSELKNADITAADISRVLCSRGPGGYTGTRVGLATVKGLMRALSIEGKGIELFDLLFSIFPDTDNGYIQAGKNDFALRRRGEEKYEFVKQSTVAADVQKDSCFLVSDSSLMKGSVSDNLISGIDILRHMFDHEKEFTNDIDPVYGRTFGK